MRRRTGRAKTAALKGISLVCAFSFAALSPGRPTSHATDRFSPITARLRRHRHSWAQLRLIPHPSHSIRCRSSSTRLSPTTTSTVREKRHTRCSAVVTGARRPPRPRRTGRSPPPAPRTTLSQPQPRAPRCATKPCRRRRRNSAPAASRPSACCSGATATPRPLPSCRRGRWARGVVPDR